MYASMQKKYPYFPNSEIKVRITPFKSRQVDLPQIYKGYKGEGYIYRIDCLSAIKKYLPVTDSVKRERVYKMVSGDCTNEELSQLLLRFYTESISFKNYVDEVFITRDENILRSIIIPLREEIIEYERLISERCSEIGGKVLISTHDYLLVKFKSKIELPFDSYAIEA